MAPIEIVLVGAGGYGEWYLDALLPEAGQTPFSLVGVVDPYLEKCKRLGHLRERGITLYSELEDFFREKRCDLVILASPIHLHCHQTCLALHYGSHVLCEKPLCASSAEIKLMDLAEKTSGKTVTIGYQWSFSSAIQQLKKDILGGRFGRPRRLRAMVGWPRDEDYYRRNLWAGCIRTATGQSILDSPVNNGTAHFLHNMLYVLGADIFRSAFPEQIEADLWRANSIENYDTASLRIRVKEAELLFYSSHSVENLQDPLFSYEFEDATVEYEPTQGNIRASLADGGVINYGSPEAEPYQKLWNAVESAQTGRRPVCGIAAAAAHTHCVLKAQESPAGIREFPSSVIQVEQSGGTSRRYVKGLRKAMKTCYEEGKIFRELQSAPFSLKRCSHDSVDSRERLRNGI